MALEGNYAQILGEGLENYNHKLNLALASFWVDNEMRVLTFQMIFKKAIVTQAVVDP